MRRKFLHPDRNRTKKIITENVLKLGLLMGIVMIVIILRNVYGMEEIVVDLHVKTTHLIVMQTLIGPHVILNV